MLLRCWFILVIICMYIYIHIYIYHSSPVHKWSMSYYWQQVWNEIRSNLECISETPTMLENSNASKIQLFMYIYVYRWQSSYVYYVILYLKHVISMIDWMVLCISYIRTSRFECVTDIFWMDDYIYIYIYTHTYIYIHTYTHMRTQMYIYIYIYIPL